MKSLFKALFGGHKPQDKKMLIVKGLRNILERQPDGHIITQFQPAYSADNNMPIRAQKEDSSVLSADFNEQFGHEILSAVSSFLQSKGETGEFDLGRATLMIQNGTNYHIIGAEQRTNKSIGRILAVNTLNPANNFMDKPHMDTPPFLGVSKVWLHNFLLDVMSTENLKMGETNAAGAKLTGFATTLFDAQQFEQVYSDVVSDVLADVPNSKVKLTGQVSTNMAYITPKVVEYDPEAVKNLRTHWKQLLTNLFDDIDFGKLYEEFVEGRVMADSEAQDLATCHLTIAKAALEQKEHWFHTFDRKFLTYAATNLTIHDAHYTHDFVQMLELASRAILNSVVTHIRNNAIEKPICVEYNNFLVEKIQAVLHKMAVDLKKPTSTFRHVGQDTKSLINNFKVRFLTFEDGSTMGVVTMLVNASGWIGKQLALIADSTTNTWISTVNPGMAEVRGQMVLRTKVNVNMFNGNPDNLKSYSIVPMSKNNLMLEIPVITFGTRSDIVANTLANHSESLRVATSIISTTLSEKVFEDSKLVALTPATREYVVASLTEGLRNGTVFYELYFTNTKSRILSKVDIEHNYTPEVQKGIAKIYDSSIAKERSISIFVGPAGTGKTRAFAGLICKFVENRVFDLICKMSASDLELLNTRQGRAFANERFFNGSKILVILEECAHLLKKREEGESSDFMSFLLDCIDGPNSINNNITWIVTGNVSSADDIDPAIINRKTRLGEFLYVDYLDTKMAEAWVLLHAPNKIDKFKEHAKKTSKFTLDFLYNTFIDNYNPNYSTSDIKTDEASLKSEFSKYLVTVAGLSVEMAAKHIELFEKSAFWPKFCEVAEVKPNYGKPLGDEPKLKSLDEFMRELEDDYYDLEEEED